MKERQEGLRWALGLHLMSLDLLGIKITLDDSLDTFSLRNLRTPLMIGLLIILITPTCYALTKVTSDLMLVIDNLTESCTGIVIITKLFFVWWNRRVLKLLMQEVIRDWRSDETLWDRSVMLRQARWVRFVTIGCLGSSWLCVAGIMFSPLMGLEARILNNITDPGMDIGRIFPAQTYYPFDATRSPIFEILYAYTVVGGFIAGFAVIAPAQLFCAIVSHAIAQYEILGNEMQHTFDQLVIDSREANEELVRIKLKRIIDSQIRFERFAKNIEEAFTMVILTEVMGLGIMVCCWGFEGLDAITAENGNSSFARILTACDPVLGLMTLVFAMCYASEMLAHHRMNCANQIYFSSWYSIPSCESRKLIILIMINSQTPIPLTAGGFFNLSLELFLMICKTIFSYISILAALTQ